MGAAEHEIDKATVKEAKRLKVKARRVVRRIGMAAVASFRPGIAPSRQPKDQWPAEGGSGGDRRVPSGPDEKIRGRISACAG